MKSLSFLLLITAIGAVGYFYYVPVLPMCRMPVRYSVGNIDESFGISEEKAREALALAEAVWEKEIGREDIFLYEGNAPLSVNFIYDERQRQADAAAEARNDLSSRGEANEVLVELHRRLVEEYESKQTDYDKKKSAYESRLNAYNAEVEKYNDEGGAPPEVYEELEERRVALDQDREAVNRLAGELNDLVARINEIGDKGNELIGEYNERVEEFNDTFVHEGEWTQGDYRSRVINVYSFDNDRELALVLAHELGHALALRHVDNPASIMYYLMGSQPNPPVLSVEDKTAFMEGCEAPITSRLFSAFTRLYNTSVSLDN